MSPRYGGSSRAEEQPSGGAFDPDPAMLRIRRGLRLVHEARVAAEAQRLADRLFLFVPAGGLMIVAVYAGPPPAEVAGAENLKSGKDIPR